MNGKLSFVFIVISLMLAACGGRASAKSVGDPEEGKRLFHQVAIREAPSCSTCHSVEPGKVIVGPSLAGIATRAADRIPEKSTSEYLHESILTPNAYVVKGFPEGVMYQKFKEVLTEEEINNLVAYLLTLK